MGRTLIEIDPSRSYASEPSAIVRRWSNDIPLSTSRQLRAWKWADGTITLKPVNLTPDFHLTRKYEKVKFRLNDVVCNRKFWGEYPEHYDAQKVPFDFHLHSKIPADSVPESFTPDNHLIPLLMQVAIYAIQLQIVRNQQRENESFDYLGAIYSRDSFPANQGYSIRWETGHVAETFIFVFGDMALETYSDGRDFQCTLWQTSDFQKWGSMASFTMEGTGHPSGQWASVIIYPHGQDCIEIAWQAPTDVRGGDAFDGKRVENVRGSFVYRVPFETKNASGEHIITKPGQWGMFFGRRFRPVVQISKLAFYDGNPSAHEAVVIDEPQDMGYAPTLPLESNVIANLNGGTVTRSLVAVEHQVGAKNLPANNPFISDGKNRIWQMKAALRGKGDIASDVAGVVPYSSITPELYGYVVRKDPKIAQTVTVPRYGAILSARLDLGSAPENESCTILLDNSSGDFDDLVARSHVPFRLLDESTGLTLFEGTAYEVEAGEAPAQAPRTLQLQGRGMADSMLWTYPADLDFTDDLNNPGQAYSWQEALRACFAEVGEVADNLLFHIPNPDEHAKDYDFPLWRPIDSGGASTGGTKAVSQDGERWRPNALAPVYRFVDNLVRSVMGWHFHRDKVTSKWLIYKRPQPADVDKLVPKAAFFDSPTKLNAWKAQNTDSKIPCFLHAALKKTNRRPEATTLIGYSHYASRPYGTRAQLEELLRALTDLFNPDSQYYGERLHCITCENPRGFPQEGGLFEYDPNHPDARGQRIVRMARLSEAGSTECLAWLTRRFYEDLCIGQTEYQFDADWGGEGTYDLKKWDLVLVDPDPDDPTSGRHWLDRFEAQWSHDRDRRAHYTTILFREDAPPPR